MTQLDRLIKRYARTWRAWRKSYGYQGGRYSSTAPESKRFVAARDNLLLECLRRGGVDTKQVWRA